MEMQILKISLRIPVTIITTAVIALSLPLVFAQAPVNDVVSWPPGLLLLATVLYATLGTSPHELWEIEPVTGIFLFTGLPKLSIRGMQRVNWVTSACHFVPGIRSAYGRANFWVRSNSISAGARAQALERVLSQLRCVTYRPLETPLNEDLWEITSAGLMIRVNLVPQSPTFETKCPAPVARDFLLFAAIDYHAFREWEVQVFSNSKMVFCTKNMPPSSIIDVASERDALYVVTAQMVRRPHSQSPLRGVATRVGDNEYGPVYTINLDLINHDIPMCAIDFHSYAPQGHKVSATLSELARSYFRVVQYLKQNSLQQIGLSGQVARVEVGQTLWISILGGAVLDTGRLTIQNLPGRWGMKGVSADDAYLTRIDSVLQQLAPYAGTATEFGDLVFSGGINRRSAVPFFIAGIFGQIVVCYFLSVGTSAGVWTSVALANSLYAGRLTDWHSMYYGKALAKSDEQPGMKMYVPGSSSKALMVIATFDRSTPKEGGLRPGFFMATCGLAAAILGAIFVRQTRVTLRFGPSALTPSWILYTAVVLCLGTTLLVTSMLVVQQSYEKTWWEDSELPTRWMAYSTFSCSVAVCVLAVVFKLKGLDRLWPVLDALTWLSGVPLGMLENGRSFSADDNMLHLVFINRWMMGAVASALGSGIRG